MYFFERFDDLHTLFQNFLYVGIHLFLVLVKKEGDILDSTYYSFI